VFQLGIGISHNQPYNYNGIYWDRGMSWFLVVYIYYWLVLTGTMEFDDFPFSWEFPSIPTDEFIFFRGVETTNQVDLG